MCIGDAQTVLRLGRGETVTSTCLWSVKRGQQDIVQTLVVATEQGPEVGRILLFDTHHASALLAADDVLAKLKLPKPVKAVQALDNKYLVVSVEYQLLVYGLFGSTLVRREHMSMSRTVTTIDSKDGVLAMVLLTPIAYLHCRCCRHM